MTIVIEKSCLPLLILLLFVVEEFLYGIIGVIESISSVGNNSIFFCISTYNYFSRFLVKVT